MALHTLAYALYRFLLGHSTIDYFLLWNACLYFLLIIDDGICNVSLRFVKRDLLFPSGLLHYHHLDFCSHPHIEDEDHLLLVCPVHHDIRCKFGQQLGKQLTPCSLVPELMHLTTQKVVALYLVSCLHNRSVLLKSTR
jgi:hypothetical protein